MVVLKEVRGGRSKLENVGSGASTGKLYVDLPSNNL